MLRQSQRTNANFVTYPCRGLGCDHRVDSGLIGPGFLRAFASFCLCCPFAFSSQSGALKVMSKPNGENVYLAQLAQATQSQSQPAQQPYAGFEDHRRFGPPAATTTQAPRKTSIIAWLLAIPLALFFMIIVALAAIGAIAGPTQPASTISAPFETRPAANFSLLNVMGERVDIETTERHLLILSAVACQDCRDRVERDRVVARIAEAHGFTVSNLLVFADQNTGPQFASRFEPYADHVLVDDGQVAVNQYGGSDAMCWIVVEKERIVWQGPADLNLIAEYLVR